jgi:hypothetical protein
MFAANVYSSVGGVVVNCDAWKNIKGQRRDEDIAQTIQQDKIAVPTAAAIGYRVG